MVGKAFTAQATAEAAPAAGNVLDVLRERGFVAEVSDEAGLRRALKAPITVYNGYDPTATSLHVGHQLTLMMLAHFQRHGHRPIALLGGGTGMIGDPTDRTAQRPILNREQLEYNISALRPIFSRYLDFEPTAGPRRALLLNNADWLLTLGYIPFLRDIGVRFSVNQLLSHSTYRERLENDNHGLNFIELNYVLLQAYDFLHLHREYGCLLQVGGHDQWFNILAGADLIRRVEGHRAYALVAPLLTTTGGAKMGKTAGGQQIWLDPAQTTPFNYYQYWINVEDGDVERLLKLFTFLPLDEIAALARLRDAGIREAKERLAFEATLITHGVAAATDARAAAEALFGSSASGAITMPSTTLPDTELDAGMPVVDLVVRSGLRDSKSEARRAIAQGGVYLNGVVVSNVEARVARADFDAKGTLLLRVGKKRYHRFQLA